MFEPLRNLTLWDGIRLWFQPWDFVIDLQDGKIVGLYVVKILRSRYYVQKRIGIDIDSLMT